MILYVLSNIPFIFVIFVIWHNHSHFILAGAIEFDFIWRAKKVWNGSRMMVFLSTFTIRLLLFN